MKESSKAGCRRRICALVVAVFIAVFAPEIGAEDSPFREPSLQAGAPFSLNGYDAVDAVYRLRRTLFLRRRVGAGEYETVRIRQVRAVRLDDAERPITPFERKRYDILLNGEPLDWENSYIEQGGRMINLRLLYTYRNGALPEGLRFTDSE